MNFSYYIAKRYLFTKSKNNAINIITIIASVGVFAGALALFIVLSGFSGLKEFSLSFSNEFDPDLKILPASGKTFSFTAEEEKKFTEISGIANYSKVIEERVLLNFKNKNLPAIIKGIDRNYLNVNHIDSSLVAGTWLNQSENQVVIGSNISRKLSLGVMDYSGMLKIMVPRPGKGQITDPTQAFNTKNAMVIGVYNINEDLNAKYIFAPFSLAQDLLEIQPNKVSTIEIQLTNAEAESKVKEELKNLFGNENIVLKNRIQLNDKLYKMLNTENLAVYLIFTLVLIIALFNVGGAIVMAILDKQHNIKTLFNLGATGREIKRVFFLQGSLLTFIGGILGLCIGFIIVLLQLKFDLVMITPTLAYPVKIEVENLIVVFFTIMILGVTASYIGATRVGKVLRD
ncbi:ABC transporter permease [Mesonia maritima]|uniref:Lipoprotein-releasing system permease protein n=1 Tax=Mesonia maritima TaxID=1793873 RepID=A0ABU1K2D5_9FLAO|nr:ABC transporter permease [Mesonia maritima]MDR6299761.1 lipoprotein-releasing system permease protein [Mesonia maritima]